MRRFAPIALALLCGCSASVTDNDPPDARDGGTRDADGGFLSRCSETDAGLHCAHHTRTYSPGGLGLGVRDAHWQVPLGAPPPSGWPVVLLFHGSFYGAGTFWDVTPDAPWGGWHQGHVTRALLDRGFAVITPSARLGTFWDTNVASVSSNWENTDDHHLLLLIFDDLESGAFGSLDKDRLYASGLSSGGYMTSRMAVSYAGRFRALAIAAASYATCAGSACVVPATLPSDHPPTLFMHGEQDTIVPISTMRLYRTALDMQGTPTREVVDADAGHAWLESAPDDVVSWFQEHR